QVYLALGTLLLGVATLEIDATPIEGFDPRILDEELGLHEKGLTGVLAQAQALNAVLLEATVRDEIQGFFVRGYNPSVVLQDKSASIYGKPGRDVIWYWYSRLTGVQ
ncbi:MAG: hypothetical protein P8Z41_17250, partial [Anaerolineales bacterium]